MTTEHKKRRGHVRLYRSLLVPPATIIRDAILLQVWIYLMLRAAYKPRSFKMSIGRGHKIVNLREGQAVIGVPKMAKFLRGKATPIRARLMKLQALGCIVYKPDTHYSIVTICNWDGYQHAAKKMREALGEPSGEALREASGEASQTETRDIQESNTLKNISLKNSSPKLRFDDVDMELARYIWGCVEKLATGQKAPNLDAWANQIRLTREVDHRTPEDIRAVFDAAHRDSFWSTNIRSPDKLRKHFDTLRMKLQKGDRFHGRVEQPANSASRIRSGNYDRIEGGIRIGNGADCEGKTPNSDQSATRHSQS